MSKIQILNFIFLTWATITFLMAVVMAVMVAADFEFAVFVVVSAKAKVILALKTKPTEEAPVFLILTIKFFVEVATYALLPYSTFCPLRR